MLHRRGVRLLPVLALVAACGEAGPPPPEGGLRISFQDREEPSAFFREAVAVRDAPKGAEGAWAAIPGLKRPERAEIVNPKTRKRVVAALFAAPRQAKDVVLSNAVADALGIDEAATVRITALRSEAQIDTTRGR